MTSPELRQDLARVDALIGLLSGDDGADEEDRRDLRWLRGERQFFVRLLAARRAHSGEKVVRLDLWQGIWLT